jgi:DnaD/phage-associated family protein
MGELSIMTTFAGFPTGKNPFVPVPEVFFTQILPQIQDSAELKVTLHLFWLLAKKQNQPRCISDGELQQDQLLLRSLRRAGDPRPAQERVLQGLEQAVARGTLLRIYLHMVDEEQDADNTIAWYFFNTTRNQKIVAELEGGEMIPARQLLVHSNGYEHEYREQKEERVVGAGMYAKPGGYENVKNMYVEIDRPNIFTLYEQNIGLLTPLIAEDLKDAINHYPEEWIEAAFREALQHNKRKWSYISAILRRWETEGRQ